MLSSHKERLLCVLLLSCASCASAQWSNAGGNAGRNGQSSEIGPAAAEILWSTSATSIIAWQPVIEDRRVYVVRQSGFPPEPNSNESPILCLDLDTGAEQWRINIPFNTGDWTTWIAGVKDGKLFAARSGNGDTSIAPLRCYDATTGAFLWSSRDTIGAGPYDGVVFADNGDPIVADFRTITRFDAATGNTVWRTNRNCSATGSCGGAIGNGAVYIADSVPGGQAIKKFDLATGAFEYTAPTMTGFVVQNTPMVSPDGTIYIPRSTNNPATDFLYAFDDSGSALTQRWAVPTQWTTSTELTVGLDGSVYFVAPGRILTRLDAATGAVIDEAADPIDYDCSGLKPRMATDALGNIYLTNGVSTNGKVYSFDAGLHLRWSDALPSINIGGPSLGPDGTLVVAGNGTNMRAYRTDHCPADTNNDGMLSPADFSAWVAAFNAQAPQCDQNVDGSCSPADFSAWVANYNAGC